MHYLVTRPPLRHVGQSCTSSGLHGRSCSTEGNSSGIITTSQVERMNWTIRMEMRSYTRLTNAFSKKVENLSHAVTIQFMYYNFARPHSSLGKNTTPAMAAGVSDHVWTLQEIAGLLD